MEALYPPHLRRPRHSKARQWLGLCTPHGSPSSRVTPAQATCFRGWRQRGPGPAIQKALPFIARRVREVGPGSSFVSPQCLVFHTPARHAPLLPWVTWSTEMLFSSSHFASHTSPPPPFATQGRSPPPPRSSDTHRRATINIRKSRREAEAKAMPWNALGGSESAAGGGHSQPQTTP